MTADEQAPPQNIEAEQAVLGSCMQSHQAYSDAAEHIGEGDFYQPRHSLIWAAVGSLVSESVPADPVLLMGRLTELGMLDKIGGTPYLHTLYSRVATPLMATHYAVLVAEAATRRRIVQAGARMTQRAIEGDTDAVSLVEWAAEQVRAARDDRKGVDILSTGWDEFLHATPDDRRMIIPGMLGVGDRLVLTGSGGLGKTTLLHQIAVCAAAGIPPLDWHSRDTFTPVRVLMMDCENPDHRVRTRLWPLVKEARDAGCPIEDRLTLGGHGNSLDLLNPQNALSLLRTVEHDKPDLLYIGPAYKLHNDDPDKEVVVKKITGVLDQVRELGVAVITEAHHTKGGKNGGSLEPSGSNLWTWWPEFGLGLRLDSDSDPYVRRCALERWRIDRDVNQWPEFVESGGRWPWARSKFGNTADYT